jgi:hypothetical protein
VERQHPCEVSSSLLNRAVVHRARYRFRKKSKLMFISHHETVKCPSSHALAATHMFTLHGTTIQASVAKRLRYGRNRPLQWFLRVFLVWYGLLPKQHVPCGALPVSNGLWRRGLLSYLALRAELHPLPQGHLATEVTMNGVLICVPVFKHHYL